MNSDQPPPPERLRPTLQLKIKANSWNGFRPTPPPERLRPTLGTENSGQLLEWIQASPERLRPTLGMNSGQPPTRKIQVNPSAAF